ncbi:MAG: hypothetical protein ACFFED_09625 [Candidatus Thorarchaeota archaeon]
METDIAFFLESLENLIDVNKRIRKIEGVILEMSKERETLEDDTNARIVKLLDEIQMLIDDVEIRANELDVQLSAIERLSKH